MFDTLVKGEYCYTTLFDRIPDYVPLDALEIRDTPLFISDEPELQRQRDIMPKETLIHAWLMQMSREDNALREKAALFWHQHFPSIMRDTISGNTLIEI